MGPTLKKTAVATLIEVKLGQQRELSLGPGFPGRFGG